MPLGDFDVAGYAVAPQVISDATRRQLLDDIASLNIGKVKPDIKFMHRPFFRRALALFGVTLTVGCASAQSYPTRALRIIVTFPEIGRAHV